MSFFTPLMTRVRNQAPVHRVKIVYQCDSVICIKTDFKKGNLDKLP